MKHGSSTRAATAPCSGFLTLFRSRCRSEFGLRMQVVSTTATAIMTRLGLRLVEGTFLWTQEALPRRRFKVRKIVGRTTSSGRVVGGDEHDSHEGDSPVRVIDSSRQPQRRELWTWQVRLRTTPRMTFEWSSDFVRGRQYTYSTDWSSGWYSSDPRAAGARMGAPVREAAMHRSSLECAAYNLSEKGLVEPEVGGEIGTFVFCRVLCCSPSCGNSCCPRATWMETCLILLWR